MLETRTATQDDRAVWLELAAEMEPVFGERMVGEPGFEAYTRKAIDAGNVFVARVAGAVAGVVSISEKHNAIAWLGVFQRHRRNGAGAALLSRALEHLDSSRPVQVVTFHRDYEAGKRALRLYRRFGFRVLYDEYLHHGLPRTLMQRDPPTDSRR